MSVTKLSTPVTPNDLINKTNEIIDNWPSGGGTAPSPATSNPIMDGTAAVGTSDKYAREDHVHPTDTSRAAASHEHAATDITSGILPPARGGTGLSSISRLLKGEVSHEDLNGDADNAPYMSVVYISNSTDAASVAHLPRTVVGHLVTIGGANGRTYQFYLVALQELPEIWVRRGHTSYSDWYKVFDSSPTFTAPTMTSGRATLQKGGYYKIGKRVYVEMTVKLAAARGANTQWTYGNGFPAPNNGYAPLAAYIANKQTYTAAISTSGILSIANGATATAVDDVIYICGSYLAAS